MAATQQFMSVTFDGTSKKATYGGGASAAGVLNVALGTSTEILVALWTINPEPGLDPAVIDGIEFPSGQPPDFNVSSPGATFGRSASSPTWVITDNAQQLGSTALTIDVRYGGVTYPQDPTIVNTDPGNVMAGTSARPAAGVAERPAAAVAA
jgi:hypothetical protein